MRWVGGPVFHIWHKQHRNQQLLTRRKEEARTSGNLGLQTSSLLFLLHGPC